MSYYKDLKRVGKNYFELTAQSPIARLSDDFPGDLYSAAPLPNVIAAILGNVVPYTVNPLLESVKVYGWLPYQDRRTSLHQLALSYGFIIRRNQNHDLYFTIPDSTAYNIHQNAIYNGGSVAYRFGETYARADITAYSFLPNDTETQRLFDNTESLPADNYIVKFDSPVFDLHADDDTLSVIASGVNYAKVSGSGRLSGKPYTKIESVVSVNGDPDADPQHVLSVSDVPLITDLNAVSVGERMLSYYNAPAIVTADIIRTNQKPGDCVSFTDPFGDPRTGYITELSGTVSGIDRASAAVVCGYAPSWGAAFDTVDVLTGNEPNFPYWTVPAALDGKTVRVVLIGGGSGGGSGQHGTDSSATGCGHGIPGDGGKVLDVKFTATAGQTFQYSVGSGGVGGSYTDAYTSARPDTMTVYVTRTGDRWHMNPHCNGGSYYPTTYKKVRERHLTPCENCVKNGGSYYVSNPGQPGTASTFGGYSSDDGHPTTAGFYDVIDGIMYAAPGPDNGMDGGSATTATENGDRTNPDYNNVQQFTVALPWDSSQHWLSGNPGSGQEYHESNPDGTINEWAYGGLGGGSAVGATGNDGRNAPYTTTGGDGGNGADASPMFPDVPYGSGGSGGHGGGEGGKGGSGHSEASYSGGAGPYSDGADGSGGSGSNGQNGGAGCILVYYKKPDALQYSFSVRDGQLILTYYTETPPPFSINNNRQLVYTYADGETPPTFEIRDGILYKIE